MNLFPIHSRSPASCRNPVPQDHLAGVLDINSSFPPDHSVSCMNLVPDHSVSSLKAGITARPEPGQLTRVEHYSDLEFMEKVGGGGYGTVSKGRWISRDKIVAIKTLIVFDEREVNH